jgi:hypothetical protein
MSEEGEGSGATKIATRGVSKNSNLDNVSFCAFKAALERPSKFAQHLKDGNVEVCGVGRLKWSHDDRGDSEELRQLETSMLQWTTNGDADDEVFGARNLTLARFT